MKCLSCEGELRQLQAGQTRIEQCAGCGGTWLDRGELDAIVDSKDDDVRWEDLDLWGKAFDLSAVLSHRVCPNGHGHLATLRYGESDIEVDVCPTCGGVWLDAGELDKIVHYLDAQAVSLSLPGYIRESLAEAKDLITGHEGLVSEWKDLRAVLRMMRLRLAVDHPTIAAILKSLPR
jgi:hypothetical protein